MARKGVMAAKGKAPVDYDLTCWYLNQRRVIDLVGTDSVMPRLGGRVRYFSL